jgi:hypothetical protein
VGVIAARSANLVGAGVNIASLVKVLSFRDVKNGASIFTGGNFGTMTTLNVRDIGDGTTIDVDGSLSLTAARIGTGKITAARMPKLVVTGDKANALRGDFRSHVTIDPGRTLTANEAKLNLLGSVVVTGHTIGARFSVPGNVGAFRTGTFEQSVLFVGFTPTNAMNPQAGGTWNGDFKLGAFRTIGYNGYTGATFGDSHVIAAKLGVVDIANLAVNNNGQSFGFAVKNGVPRNRTTIILRNPATKLLATQLLPFTLTDFLVQEL